MASYGVLASVPVRERGRWRHGARDDELELIRGTIDRRGSRAVRFEAPRPYGARRDIVAEVADFAAEKYGCTVTRRTVWSCWNEFKVFERDIRGDIEV